MCTFINLDENRTLFVSFDDDNINTTHTLLIYI